jgi:L-alanine-DL-glutamate epimerase-like enolase superfamily enzyme
MPAPTQPVKEASPMRISSLSVRLVAVDASSWYGNAPLPAGESKTWLFPLMTLETDAGVSGHSMAYGKQGEGRATLDLLKDVVEPRLVGEDPLEHGKLWQRLMRKTRDLRLVTDALTGMVDVALWDLRGRALGVSVCDLLGRCRDRMPTYATASRFLTTPELVYQEAKAAKESRYHGYKLQLWQGPRQDIPRYRAAREAVGPDFPLMEDAVAGYSFVEALEVGRVLDELGYHWFEEPIRDQHLAQLKRLADELRVPILATETAGLYEIPEYLRQSAVDLARGDVHTTAGITGLYRAATACDMFGVGLEIHTAATPLLDVANLQVACAVSNCSYLESHQELFRFGLVGSPLSPDEQGYLHLPSGPGLGVELDMDWIDDHTVAEA